ncbi:MAG TPA: type I-U CRISPR-associated protein Cas8c [Verrucomicrobiota bacterium]|nr:type I-U CRISPR-associated protein Cas8c [Verrucomicrobiales bacterium]HRI13978.1 type I-U CRISPR-associated protein Cas8c [Verrucomicrobiota bacterium]
MSEPTPTIRIRVDVTNPGQFFACCGLLELAARSSGKATGRFRHSGSETSFHLTVGDAGAVDALFEQIAACQVSSTLSLEEIARLRTLLNTKKSLLTPEVEREKSKLSEKWGCERITLKPFGLVIDWWLDEYSGSSVLKTWAGKQFVTDIIEGNLKALRTKQFRAFPVVNLLSYETDDGSLPFYFDAAIGGHSSSLDVGFSLDALSVRGRIKPAIEFLAFVGLQRFRPARDEDIFRYRTWEQDMPPILAAAVSGGGFAVDEMHTYEFPLLYRTKYLKAFLTAKPTTTSQT